MILKLSLLFFVTTLLVILVYAIVKALNEASYKREQRRLEKLQTTEKKENSLKTETKEKLQKTIKEVSEKIVFFEEVKEHILHGGGARGIIWDYSQYMTVDEVNHLIEELKTLEVYLKNIYSELLIEKELKKVDDELKDMFKLEFEDFSKKNLKNLNKNIDKLIDKFELKD